MPPRVCLLITELNPGGAEQVVFDLATGLRSDFDLFVAALDGRGAVGDRLRDAGVEAVDLGARKRSDLGAIRRLRRLLRSRRVDLLHTHLMHANVAGRLAAWRTGAAVLSTCHIPERRRVPWHFWLDRWTAPLARGEVCVSEAVRRFQQKRTGLPERFFRTIPNGIDLARFGPLPERNEIRARWGVGDAFVLGGYGRFDRQKGFDVLLRAMATATLRQMDLKLVMGGYGPQEASLKDQAEDLGLDHRVLFAGLQPGAEAFLPGLDALAIPSRYEGGGPLVLLEALACGVPLVASNVDSIPEIIRNEDDGALLAPPEDAVALADAIRRLIEEAELRAHLRAGGLRRARAYGIEPMLAAYAALYREILRTARG